MPGRYEQLRGEMADRSQTVQDTAPLVKIKDALKRLKSDICQMDLRIGVVNHTLMQAKLRQRPNEPGVRTALQMTTSRNAAREGLIVRGARICGRRKPKDLIMKI